MALTFAAYPRTLCAILMYFLGIPEIIVIIIAGAGKHRSYNLEIKKIRFNKMYINYFVNKLLYVLTKHFTLIY